MSDQRTLNIDFHWADIKVNNDGALLLTMAGVTVNGAVHKIVFTMGPSSIGYIASDLHRAVADMQKTLDQVKAQLRGE